MEEKEEIGSFVFFDLETTGLPSLNFNKCGITEFSMHACSRNDLETEAETAKNELPRVQHKLTLCFNPKMLIHPEATKLSGLDNYILEKERPFDKNAANVIISFLNQLQQPICLVAHNGNRFDFPILKTSLNKQEMELPESTLCLDSWPAILAIDKILELEEEIRKKNELKQNESNEAETDDVEKDLEFQKNLQIEFDMVDNFEKNHKNLELTDEFQSEIEKFNETSRSDRKNSNIQKINETTPRRLTKFSKGLQAKKLQHIRDGETPTTSVSTSESLPTAPRSRRSLFPENKEKSDSTVMNKVKKNYKLPSIYERRLKKAMLNAHNAEADVIALKEIAFSYGKDFVRYATNNAKPFCDIKPLGPK